jgi:acyl carrier protein
MINTDNLLTEIKLIISKVSRIDVEKITDTSSLRNDLSIDSLQASQIVAMINEKYKIEIEEVEIFNIDNVLETVEIVKEYLQRKS